MLQLAIKDREDHVNLDQGRITIGRDAANSVVLETGDVSGYHAEIHCDSGGVYVVDLGSSNGTTVNGKRLTKRQKLAAWDRVSFASVEAEVVDTEGRRPTQVSRAVGEPAPSPTGAEWRLVGKQETLGISGRHVLGRDAGCDFTLASDSVSRRHARLELGDGRLTVTDLGSTNGTFVNGKRVQESVLGVGDEVRFDVESFRVEGPDDPDQTTVRPAAGDDATRVRSAVGAAGTTTLPAATSRLEVVGGMDVQSFGLTTAKCTIGRASESDIELPVDSVSSRHAQLEKTGGGWLLTDLQSTNGTFVNDRRIDSAELKPGDRVRFGEVEVKFADDASEPAPPPETKVIPARSDTAVMDPARRLPAWGYGAIAVGVVAVIVAVLLLRGERGPFPLQARQLWTLTVEGGGVIGTPALGDVNNDEFVDVVIPDQGGVVTAADGEEGKVIYGPHLSERIMASASMGRVTEEGPPAAVVATTAGVVHAVGDDGQLLWTSDGDLDLGLIVNKPLLADVNGDGLHDVIVPTAQQGLVALEGNRGWKLWDTREMTNGRVVVSPVSADVNGDGIMDIVAATDQGQVLTISAAGGDVWQLWSAELSNAIEYASPVIVDIGDSLLVAVAAEEVVALDGGSGRVAWRMLAGESFAASLLAVDGNGDGIEDVLAVTSAGDAYLLSGQFGEDLSSGNVGSEVMATPALHDEDGDGIAEPFLVTRGCDLLVLDISNMRARLTVEGTGEDACFASPVLGDLDNDELLDVVVATDGGTVTAYSFNRPVARGAVVWGEFLGGSH